MDQPLRYETPFYSDVEYPVLFHDDYLTESRTSLYSNWHSGIEVLYCERGSAKVQIGCSVLPFSAGDFVVINSNEVHSMYRDGEDCFYDCLIVEPAFLAKLGLPSALLLENKVSGEGLTEFFLMLKQEYEKKRFLHMPLVLACVTIIFCTLYRRNSIIGSRKTDSSALYANLTSAINYMNEHLKDDLSVEELAKIAGMSKYYFCHNFKLYTGFSPIRYLNNLRCEVARSELRKGATVCMAANEVGIENISYFTRLYKSIIGNVPSADMRKK